MDEANLDYEVEHLLFTAVGSGVYWHKALEAFSLLPVISSCIFLTLSDCPVVDSAGRLENVEKAMFITCVRRRKRAWRQKSNKRQRHLIDMQFWVRGYRSSWFS